MSTDPTTMTASEIASEVSDLMNRARRIEAVVAEMDRLRPPGLSWTSASEATTASAIMRAYAERIDRLYDEVERRSRLMERHRGGT